MTEPMEALFLYAQEHMICALLAREAGIDLSALSLAGLFSNLVPVTIGNIIGGCGFAALIWACHRTSK